MTMQSQTVKTHSLKPRKFSLHLLSPFSHGLTRIEGNEPEATDGFLHDGFFQAVVIDGGKCSHGWTPDHNKEILIESTSRYQKVFPFGFRTTSQ